MLDYWFPWLDMSHHIPANVSLINKDKPVSEPLSTEQQNVLHTVAAAEMQLYEFAQARYQAQWTYVKSLMARNITQACISGHKPAASPAGGGSQPTKQAT